jgi:plastocyanin
MRQKMSGAGRALMPGVVAVLLTACASSGLSGTASKGSAGPGAVEIVTEARAFAPATLSLSAGEQVTVEVTNEDSEPHDFAIESLRLNTGVIAPGEVATATFTLHVGDTPFVCTLHPDMTGTITAS